MGLAGDSGSDRIPPKKRWRRFALVIVLLVALVAVGVLVFTGFPVRTYPRGQVTCEPRPMFGNGSTVNVSANNSTVLGAPSTIYTFHHIPLEFLFASSVGNQPFSPWKLIIAWGNNWNNSTTIVSNGCVPTYVHPMVDGTQLTIAYSGTYMKGCGSGCWHQYANAYVTLGNVTS